MFGKMLSKSLQSFCQHGFNIGQHFLAQQHKRLFGAAGRNAGAMNVFAGEEPLLDRACCGEGVAEEMRAGQIEPVLQRFAVKAGANGGVEKRLACAAMGDFCVAIYNPSSKARPDYLQRAVRILLQNGKSEETVCGIVRNIGRERQQSEIITLRELENKQVDMFTTVYIGNKATKNIESKMVTPRGYRTV